MTAVTINKQKLKNAVKNVTKQQQITKLFQNTAVTITIQETIVDTFVILHHSLT